MRHAPRLREIVVVGAGLAGLAAALALVRAGFAVRVVEQAGEFGEIGAGITVSPNAVRAFRHLGLGAEVEQASTRVGIQGVVYFETGKVLGTKDREAMAARCGAPFLQLLRPDLHAILVQALLRAAPGCVTLGRSVVSVEQADGRAVVSCDDGSRMEADLVVGADGIRSRVRACVFDADQPRFTGRVAWRGLVPTSSIPEGLLPFASGAAVGPGRTFGWYMVRHGTLVNYVAIVKTDEFRDEGWRIPSTREAVLAHFQGGLPLIAALIGATDPATVFRWALCDRPPQPRWVRERVVLLGDAAHPMLPYMGQGAAMGFEDAVVLARCLAEIDSPDAALAAYQYTRQPRATLVHRGSAARADMWEARDVKSGLSGDAVDEERELFPYDAGQTPLRLEPVVSIA